MGNLKLKMKGTKGGNTTNEKIDEDPAPVKTDEPGIGTTKGEPENNDLPKKRKLSEYLLSQDLNIFKRHLPEVKNLDDEKFNQLFEGNAEYNYNVKDEKGFRQLAQKFEDNKDLLYECYGNEGYFKYALQIWKPNILQGLKEAEGDQKKNEILNKYKIDISSWDPTFREAFNIMINTTPIKSLAERMVNYMEADYGDFDELIKNCDKCKKNINKDTNTHCNKVLSVNLDSSMSRILNDFVPGFLKQIAGNLEKIPGDIKKAEENAAIKQILNTSSGQIPKRFKKQLINGVKKIYKEKNKDSTIFSFNEEYKKLRELSKQFNKEDDMYYAFGHGKIYFKEMGFKDKANVAFGNKIVKHAVLGLSLANLTYSVMHLTKTFMDHKAFQEQFKFRLNEIRQRFVRHQGEVKVITEETDIDQAVKLVIECGKKFQQDLDDAEELISEITDAMNGVKTEKNKTIMNMIGSGGGFLIGLFGAAVTKGEDRLEYSSASLADVLAFAANAADIKKQNEIMEEYKKTLQNVVNLKNEIINEIDKLRNKFNELKAGHYS